MVLAPCIARILKQIELLQLQIDNQHCYVPLSPKYFNTPNQILEIYFFDIIHLTIYNYGIIFQRAILKIIPYVKSSEDLSYMNAQTVRFKLYKYHVRNILI